MDPIRVVIADDSPAMRAAIRRALSRMPNIEFIGEASNGQEAIQMVLAHEPDVLLLDIEMPVMNGIEAVRYLVDAKCQVKVIILSAYNDRQLILMMLEGGAAGYLVKNDAPSQLNEAVLHVAKGQRNWMSKEAFTHTAI